MSGFPVIKTVNFSSDGIAIEQKIAEISKKAPDQVTPHELNDLKRRLDAFLPRAHAKGDTEVLFTAARAQLLLGESAAARRTLEQVLAADPTSAPLAICSCEWSGWLCATSDSCVKLCAKTG